MLAQARVLEATDRVDEIEALVEHFFAGTAPSEDDTETRVTLLLRLAELQTSRPAKAIASLEKASALDPEALGADDRRQLAALYESAGTEGEQVLDNHRALLSADPLYVPSLAALADHAWQSGRLDQAWALYSVLAIAEPSNEPARLFLEAHEVSEGDADPLNVDALKPSRLADGGIGRALELLWEGASSVLADHVPKLDVPAEARISPLGDTPLAQTWAEMLKRLGASKVALVDAEAHEIEAASEPDGVAGTELFCVQYAHPPVILARGESTAIEDAAALRFALGRALHMCGPQGIFAAGLPRARVATLVSATLQAYHPRHSRRKHHQKSEDEIAKLSQELVRKLPRKVGRELSQLFRDHETETFDSRTWRTWIAQGSNRVGLALGGDIWAALVTLLNEDEMEPDALRERVAADPEIRDLVSFAASETYVRSRVGLGHRVSAK